MNHKIVLMGCDFTCPNKGCEALSFSVVSLLKNIYGNESIEIVNVTYKDSLGEFPDYFPNIKFINWRMRFKSLSYYIETIKMIQSCDAVLDITYGDSFSDIYGKSWLIKTNINKFLGEKFCRKFVLMPQTYGPFYNNRLKKQSLRLISKAGLAYSRDEKSINYLQSNSVNNVHLTTDLAMALPYDDSTSNSIVKTDKVNIGVNVSSLLWDNYGESNKFNLTVDYREYTYKLIEYLLNHNYYVYLIPHVIDDSDGAPENDLRPMKKIKDKFNEVILIENVTNPVEIKNIISSMDMFVGARMHATIAAYSSYVPVIPFSYSRKFEGLFESLNYPYVIHGNTMSTSDAISKTIDLINSKNSLIEAEDEGMKIVQEDLKDFFESLKKYLITL